MSDFRSKIKQIRTLLGRSPTRLGEGTAESFLLRCVLFEALGKTVGRYYRESVGRVLSAQIANKESLDPMESRLESNLAAKMGRPVQVLTITTQNRTSVRAGVYYKWRKG